MIADVLVGWKVDPLGVDFVFEVDIDCDVWSDLGLDADVDIELVGVKAVSDLEISGKVD